MDESSVDFQTLAAHAGLHARIDEATATVAPIMASTTFTYDVVEDVHAALHPESHGFAYSRNANPTVAAFEATVATLEDAADAVAFGSGMAAVHAALLAAGLRSGDTVVAASDLYGVTRALLLRLADLGIRTRFCDATDAGTLDYTVGELRPRLVIFEAISNPLLRVSNVSDVARIARKHGATSVIDNTFASPFLLQPLAHGVDLVVHSVTKYISGHGDVTAGIVAGSGSLVSNVRAVRTLFGGILSPFEAWLAIRGVKTLPVRMAAQCATAFELSEWLEEQSWVEQAFYPGLGTHPQTELAAQQFGGYFGAMVAFNVRGSRDAALQFMNALQVITPGTTLGDVESLILYPAETSHRHLSEEERAEVGIGPGLLRLSVGLESPRDLIADLEQAATKSGLNEVAKEIVGATASS